MVVRRETIRTWFDGEIHSRIKKNDGGNGAAGERQRKGGTTIISDDRSREWSTRRGIMKTLRDLRRRRQGNFCREVAVYLGIAIIPGATRYRKNDALSPRANASIKILKNRDGEEWRGSTRCVRIICIPCISTSINNTLFMIYRVYLRQPTQLLGIIRRWEERARNVS